MALKWVAQLTEQQLISHLMKQALNGRTRHWSPRPHLQAISPAISLIYRQPLSILMIRSSRDKRMKSNLLWAWGFRFHTRTGQWFEPLLCSTEDGCSGGCSEPLTPWWTHPLPTRRGSQTIAAGSNSAHLLRLGLKTAGLKLHRSPKLTRLNRQQEEKEGGEAAEVSRPSPPAAASSRTSPAPPNPPNWEAKTREDLRPTAPIRKALKAQWGAGRAFGKRDAYSRSLYSSIWIRAWERKGQRCRRSQCLPRPQRQSCPPNQTLHSRTWCCRRK